MPRMNGTGPEGMGAMTGRGMGRCAGSATPGQGFGSGMGRGSGFMGGCRRAAGMLGFRWMRSQAPGLEKDALALEAEALESRLAAVKRRLGALEPEAK